MDGFTFLNVHLSYSCDSGTLGIPVPHPFAPSLFPGKTHEFPNAFNEFEFQPMENCPRNFVIFDQSDNKSRVMFHPTLVRNSSYHQGMHFQTLSVMEDAKSSGHHNREAEKLSSSYPSKDDSDEIDVLLMSSDEEEDEDYCDDGDGDDDLVSTGRTPAAWVDSSRLSSDSAEERGYRSPKRACTRDSYTSCGSSNEKRKEQLKRMVDALKGIIPGADCMDTPAILNEAVKYLESLKVEAEKLGIENTDGEEGSSSSIACADAN